jgi:hypothetical protein
MARPIKVGLDYFPLDCVLDDKIELIEAEFGLTGFAIIIKLFQKIYGEQGYYCEFTSEVALLFARKNGVGGNVVSEVIESSFRRGIFNRDLYEEYRILTSKGIQKRYFEAVAKNRRKQIEVKEEYLLIKVTLFFENSDNNPINVDINPINADRNTQRKEKESKEKKRKEKESKRSIRSALSPYGQFNNVFLSDEELAEGLHKYPNSFRDKIERLSSYMMSSGRNYPNHYAKLIEFLEEDQDEQKAVEQRSKTSYDIDELEKIEPLDDF